jgi:uncharacterized protein (TIGR00730 family)
MTESRHHPFPDAQQDRESAQTTPDTPQTRSPTNRLAFHDEDFLLRREVRPVRLQLELLKAEMLLAERGIESTVVMFGGARILPPEREDEARSKTLREMSHFYSVARVFARAVTERSIGTGGRENVIVTGGGPGVMEAGNRGAADAGGSSIGFGVVLPHEQAPNEWVTPELCFNFHYFAIRKMHFLMRANAVAVFPGGFGTMDELFECLTLIQTGRMERLPVLLFGRAFWETVVNFEALAEAGTIARADLELFRFVETAEEALHAMDTWEHAGERRQVIPGRPEPTR